jgi:hypothetical protein
MFISCVGVCVKAAGAVYQGKGFTAIGLYNSYADIYSALPESLMGTHAIHTEYDYRNKQNHGETHSIDTYLITDNSSVDSILAITKAKGIRLKDNFYSSMSQAEQEELLKKYNINSLVLKDLRGTDRLFALQSNIAEDIDGFAESPPELTRPSFITYVPEIIPETKIRYVVPKKSGQYLQPGKSDFIPSCLFGGNQDFVKPKSACIVSFVPMSKDAYFDSNKGVFVGYYDLKTGDCRYCYAGHHHLNGAVKDVFTIIPERQQKEMREGTFKDFNKNIYGRKVAVLRLGKRTETGARIFRPQLLTTIDSCIEVGTDLVMPTKLLEYDPDVVKGLLKMKQIDLDGSLLFSISNRDKLERGAIAYGRSNEARLETAIEYGMAGVNSNIYMMMEVTRYPMSEHLKTINRALKAGLGVQILGARVTRKDVAGDLTGRTWEELQGKLRMSIPSKNMYGEVEPAKMIGAYTMTPNTELHPATVHPEILKMIADNNGQVRMCNHNSCNTYCGGCFIGKGNIHKTVEVKREKAATSSTRTKKKDTSQRRLGFDFGESGTGE